jgi:cobalamin biosynthesis protein CobT
MNKFEDLDAKRVKFDDSVACDVGVEEKKSTEDDNDEKESEIAEQEEEEESETEESETEESEAEESETEESETEKVKESVEWDRARDKCRIMLAEKLAKKRGVSHVSYDELNKFIKGKLGWITHVLWKYDFEFVDSEMLDECCEHLGFKGGILDQCMILSFAMPAGQSIYSF